MWAVLLVAIVLAFLLLKSRETFVVKYGNPLDNQDLLSFDPKDRKLKRAVGLYPDTCPAEHPDQIAGICYEDCDSGYHAVGPVCWADTVNIGVGKVLNLRNCARSGYQGWTDTGLLCNEPIRCASGWAFFTEGCSGGRVRPKKLACDNPEFPDEIASLCYRKCPKDLPNHVPGMPYLCFKGDRGLSYPRASSIPPLYAFGE